MKYILDTSWSNLAEFRLSNPVTELPPDRSIVHCHLDEINQFFNLLESSESENKYILISSRSDYGLDYQEDFPVSKDMEKVFQFNKIDSKNYDPLIIPARCNVDKCKITDKYSIRMYQFTGATFNYVPKNIVKWYVVNCNIEHPRIERIPFGVSEEFMNTAEEKLVSSYAVSDVYQCYVNFSPNTIERANLLKTLQNCNGFRVKRNVSCAEYVEDILESDAVLCPFGNGWDSYRVLETIYLGKIPIWEKQHRILSAYSGIQYGILGGGGSCADLNYENTKVDLDYWQSKINKDKEELSVVE